MISLTRTISSLVVLVSGTTVVVVEGGRLAPVPDGGRDSGALRTVASWSPQIGSYSAGDIKLDQHKNTIF